MSPTFDTVKTKQDLHSDCDLDRLRWQVVKCRQIVASATDAVQRDLYSKLAQYYQARAMEIERDVRNKQVS